MAVERSGLEIISWGGGGGGSHARAQARFLNGRWGEGVG